MGKFSQSEAGQTRKRRSAEIRANEQSRQWDRQREDIHPVEVLERLASLEAKHTAVAPLPRPSLILTQNVQLTHYVFASFERSRSS